MDRIVKFMDRTVKVYGPDRSKVQLVMPKSDMIYFVLDRTGLYSIWVSIYSAPTLNQSGL